MRIATRYTLGLTLGALGFFGAAGVAELRSEERELRAATVGSMELLGRSLTVAFENALRDRQSEDVEETLGALERIDPTVDIFVLAASGRVLAASEDAALPGIAIRDAAPGVSFQGAEGAERLCFVSRIAIRDGSRGRLVVLRPLDDMRADLRATRVGIVAAILGFVAVVAALGAALGRFYVSRPLGDVIGTMGRVRDGDLRPHAGPFADDEIGEAREALAALVDALREARDDLEAESERRHRLERGLDEVAKLVAIGRLSASVAHEIGSPLQVIEGRVASLAKRSSDPEVSRVAAILLAQTRRITRIVEQLLDVSRRGSARRASGDVVAIVRPIVELLAHEARAGGVALALDAEAELPRAIVDADQVQQIVFNLVRNALQASDDAGRVGVRVERGALAGTHEPCVRIVVRDEGRGMADAVLVRACEPFFTTRRESGGTGLGLAVVRGLVDEHHGRFAIESVEGRGTVAVVELPLEPPASRRGEEVVDGAAS